MKRDLRLGIAYLLGLVIAAILAVAAFFKAADPGMFAEQISAYRVTPASWSIYLAYFFVAVELALAAALVAFVWPRLLFAGTILLMLGFIGVTAYAWTHGGSEGCGCFGRLVDRGPFHVIIEDSLIVIASLLCLRWTRGFRTRAWRWALFGILMIPVVVLTVFGPSLPLDSIVIGIGPGSDLSALPIEDAGAPLEEGTVLLVLLDDGCPACQAGLPRLREIASDRRGPRVLAAYAGSAAEAQRWRMRQLPNFRIAHAPQKALRPYYRSLPVTLLLEEGIVQRVWWGHIPAASAIP
ncbi:MAG: hypothetical protein GF330_03455 [Candidatus Eisenbacteria bacterium]|nr:hypothetical protein [Candidatus Eisenbacteria bacterium]